MAVSILISGVRTGIKRRDIDVKIVAQLLQRKGEKDISENFQGGF